MSIHTDIKLAKLEMLLDWLVEERALRPSEEMDKLIKRVEQQITFLDHPDETG